MKVINQLDACMKAIETSQDRLAEHVTDIEFAARDDDFATIRKMKSLIVKEFTVTKNQANKALTIARKMVAK